jgi:hypothetical protein
MNSPVSASTPSQTSRILVEDFERGFELLEAHNRELLQKVPPGLLYKPADLLSPHPASVGELVLKSAGAIEQTCGGLTANLWDDPFEWTLPETLSTPALITAYLDEVTQTRATFFARLKEDGDLTKHIAVPAGETQTLVRVLLATLIRSAGYQERATVILEMLSQARSLEV